MDSEEDLEGGCRLRVGIGPSVVRGGRNKTETWDDITDALFSIIEQIIHFPSCLVSLLQAESLTP